MNNLSKQQQMDKLLELVEDASKHRFPERYALLYQKALDTDNRSILVPFYISDLKNALTMLDKKQKQSITKLFGLNGGVVHYFRNPNPKDIALMKLYEDAEDALLKLRSLNCMYIYAPKVRKYVDMTACKVWDPEEKYDNLTKAKYVCLHYVFLLNYNRFPLDKKEPNFNYQKKFHEERNYMLPYFIVEAYDVFFSTLPDGDLFIPMIDAFFDNVDPELKDAIYKYAQISGDTYVYESLYYLRCIKEQLFPNGSWKSDIDFFKLSSIKKLSITQFRDGLRSYLKYERDINSVDTHIETVLYSDSVKSVTVYDFYKGFSVGDPQELLAYRNLAVLLASQMPDIPLGKRRIPFVESSLCKYLQHIDF